MRPPPIRPSPRPRGLLVGTAALLAACSAGPAAPPGESVRSSNARLAPTAPATDVAQLVDDDTEFATRMYRHVVASGGNAVFSPHSISVALGMTWAGARGTTESQMADALRFSLAQARLHPAFNALDQALAARATAASMNGGQPFRLRVVNALFGQRGYRFLAPFLDTLAEHYGAGLSLLDFARDAETSRGQINAWVAAQTEQRIPELLPRGAINGATTLVLTNAVYFNASWYRRFDPAATATGAFRRPTGGDVAVPFMNQVAELRYAAVDGWEAVELGYVSEAVSMLVVLPAEGTLAAFEAALDARRVRDIVAALGTRRVTLALPRFRIRTPVGLRAALQALGMRDAFDAGAADFSGMDGTRDLFIQDVVHEGFIAVDEAGTEAAAATAVIVGRVSLPEPATFRADRAFLFLVRDNATGAVIFMGRVVDPST